ncbi:hypothetical protein H0B56_07410 [Haloechinothrix sp. YIM 98757]|uniref:Uncharacterized protein n=1 Tax=Haloechinothrix aidingensis TaxID=2752311 RepID=A0A837ZXK7_9PSEU|nr:Rv3235 family protein [Haloechinothrix aidingensis]MBA0125366.1 hypothetical protein [Haloechinothrix aidingensis]
MSQTARQARETPLVRPLDACEPYRVAPQATPRHQDQLVLPLATASAGHGGPATTGDATTGEAPGIPDPPAQPELRSLLTALIEVATGQRYVARLRSRLSEPVVRKWQARPRVPPERRYVLGTVHQQRCGVRALEVCATAHGRTHAFALLTRLDARWHGWLCTGFDVLLPPAAGYARSRAHRAA